MAKPGVFSRVKQAINKLIAPIQARYDAAGSGRRMVGWNPPSSGPNAAIQNTQKLRDRARDTVRNDWSGEAIAQKWSTTLVGVGVVPRLKRVKSATRRQELKDLWDDFVATSDADGVLNFYGQQTLGIYTWVQGGEFFLRRRDRRPEAGLWVPLQVQMLESEMLPMLDADTYQGLPIGNRIRSGIELNRSNQRIAYWFYKEHPGDGGSMSFTASEFVRIPAAQVKHVYIPNRPGALRGVSMLAPILARLRNIADYDDAVLERQKLANLFMAFIAPPAQTSTDGPGVDPMTGAPLIQIKDQFVASLEPGATQVLEAGETVNFANPPEPGTMFHEYIRTQHMGTAAAVGIPYELMSGDIRDISDRTLRVLVNEFRRLAEQRQWQMLIPMMCQPVRDWFCDACLLNGDIAQAEFEDVRRVEWATHGFAHIHPVQDPQGKKLEVDAGFRSRSSVVGERGDDPAEVDAERAEDMQREKDLDLWVDPNPPPAGAKPDDGSEDPDEDGIDNQEYNAPPNARARARARARAALRRPQ